MLWLLISVFHHSFVRSYRMTSLDTLLWGGASNFLFTIYHCKKNLIINHLCLHLSFLDVVYCFGGFHWINLIIFIHLWSLSTKLESGWPLFFWRSAPKATKWCVQQSHLFLSLEIVNVIFMTVASWALLTKCSFLPLQFNLWQIFICILDLSFHLMYIICLFNFLLLFSNFSKHHYQWSLSFQCKCI